MSGLCSPAQSKYYHLSGTGWSPGGRRQNVKSVRADSLCPRRGLGKGWVGWLMDQIKQQLETSHGLDVLVFIKLNGTFPLQVRLQIFSEINNLSVDQQHSISSSDDLPDNNLIYRPGLICNNVQLPKMINATSWPWTSPLLHQSLLNSPSAGLMMICQCQGPSLAINRYIVATNDWS